MKPTRQTVYLPVNGDGLRVTKGGYDTYDIVEEQQGHFFTPEQLNEYTQSVIKQALETAAEKAEIKERKVSYSSSSGSEYAYVQSINKQSITNTFEVTFKLFKNG